MDGCLFRFGAGEVETRMLSASYSHDPVVTLQIIGLLPDIVHIRASQGGEGLMDAVRLLTQELGPAQIGSAVILNRVVDILLVRLLRVWLAAQIVPVQGS